MVFISQVTLSKLHILFFLGIQELGTNIIFFNNINEVDA